MNGEVNVRRQMEENNVVPGVTAGDVISINVEGDGTTEAKVVTIRSSSGPVNVSVTFDGMIVATVSSELIYRGIYLFGFRVSNLVFQLIFIDSN